MPSPATLIRPGREDDVPAVAEIYAHHVLHGTGTFETEPPTAAEMAARRAEVLARGLPYLVLGRGLGRALLAELAAQAERAGVRRLIAVIGDSANAGSIAVHRAIGFTPVGTLRACGWKFGRWLDVVLMERVLGAGSTEPPDPSGCG